MGTILSKEKKKKKLSSILFYFLVFFHDELILAEDFVFVQNIIQQLRHCFFFFPESSNPPSTFIELQKRIYLHSSHILTPHVLVSKRFFFVIIRLYDKKSLLVRKFNDTKQKHWYKVYIFGQEIRNSNPSPHIQY